jgi:hypothetical protein
MIRHAGRHRRSDPQASLPSTEERPDFVQFEMIQRNPHRMIHQVAAVFAGQFQMSQNRPILTTSQACCTSGQSSLREQIQDLQELVGLQMIRHGSHFPSWGRAARGLFVNTRKLTFL